MAVNRLPVGLLALLAALLACSAQPLEVVELTSQTFEHHTQAGSGQTSGSWQVLSGLFFWLSRALAFLRLSRALGAGARRNRAGGAHRYGARSLPLTPLPQCATRTRRCVLFVNSSASTAHQAAAERAWDALAADEEKTTIFAKV